MSMQVSGEGQREVVEKDKNQIDYGARIGPGLAVEIGLERRAVV